MSHRVTLIPGDGIGSEVSAAAVRLVEATGVQVEWETINAGADALSEYGTFLPDSLLESLRRNGVGLKSLCENRFYESRIMRLKEAR